MIWKIVYWLEKSFYFCLIQDSDSQRDEVIFYNQLKEYEATPEFKVISEYA